MKILEIQASLLEVTDKTVGSGKDAKTVSVHSKHVAVRITDPAVCAAIQQDIEKSLAAEQEAADIKGDDQFTLENCEDASSFELTGKDKLSEAEVKTLLANKKKKQVPAA